MSDLSEIVAFAKGWLKGTNYEGHEFNSVIARRTVKEAMTSPNARVWITEDEGKVVGLLIGEIGPMTMTHRMGATDLAFLPTGKGGDLLLDAFLEWCKLRKVGRIDMGISAGPGREEAVKRAMRRKGFAYSGLMFHINFVGDDRERAEENPQSG